MKEIERKFYTESLKKVLEEEETEEEKECWVNFLRATEEQIKQHPPSFNVERVKWFEELTQGVIEFAESCALDVKMRLTSDCCGSILFETSYFELSAFDDLAIRQFWLYLCQRGRLTITHANETFKIEFLFALYDKQADYS